MQLAKLKPRLLLALFALSITATSLTHAAAERCSASWPSVQPYFESTIQYGDPQRKADPFVTVYIGGKFARMLLDTGTNRHVIWDSRLVDGDSGTTVRKETLNAIASSTSARRVELDVDDTQGRGSRQAFYVIEETPLMAVGFSGIISPQYLADEKVVILNFQDDCFFVSSRFDPASGGAFGVAEGTSLPNVHRVLAIGLGVSGARVPVVVDSGAYYTTLSRALIRNKAAGGKRKSAVDLLGREIAGDTRMRLVDLTINGEMIPSHSVASQDTSHAGGVMTLGAVGMDVLRNRIVYYDGDRNRFSLLTPRKQGASENTPTPAALPEASRHPLPRRRTIEEAKQSGVIRIGDVEAEPVARVVVREEELARREHDAFQ